MAVGSLCTTLLWRLSAGVKGWVTALLAFTHERGCTLRLSKPCCLGFSVIAALYFLPFLFLLRLCSVAFDVFGFLGHRWASVFFHRRWCTSFLFYAGRPLCCCHLESLILVPFLMSGRS